jgi:hypothetical protein
MSNKRNRMSVGDLKRLYPTIELMEGYDRAFVGIVPAPDGGCLAVYDSMKIVSMLHKQGFSSQEALLAHFEGMLASAQKTKKVGPLFMQATSIIDPTATEQEDDDDEVDAFNDLEWEDSSDSDSESDSDSDSDSDHDWNDGDDPGEEGEEGEEGIEDSGYDEDVSEPYMEITVDIGINDPDHCVLNSNANKIKEAIRIIFPNLPRLDMVGKAKFMLRNLDEMED